MSDDLAELRRAVWNPDFMAVPDARRQDLFDHALLEQYKLYVEMADRISSRRALTNSFFLTVNLAVSGVIGSVSANNSPKLGLLSIFVGGSILLCQCFVWFYTLRSYRMLNKAKYSVIEVLEERLPSRIYSKAEWGAYVRSGARGKYLRLTTAEQMMPTIFGLGYIAVAIYLLA